MNLARENQTGHEYITKEVGTKDTDNVLWTLF